MQMRFRDYAAVYAIGSVGYSAVEILWRGFTQWKDAHPSALEKMPCGERRDYGCRIYSGLYCQPDVSYECLGLFFNGRKSDGTGMPLIYGALVFALYPGDVDIQQTVSVYRIQKKAV